MDKEVDGTFKFKVPDGKYVLFALVKIRGFLEVIQWCSRCYGTGVEPFQQAGCAEVFE
ncbi:MAG: hypothetical protein ACLR6J_04105 [Parabacteroides merdae]